MESANHLKDELTNTLLSVSAAVLISKEQKTVTLNDGVPFTIVDTLFRDERNRISFTTYVQMKAAYFDQKLSFELAMLKVGSEDQNNNYWGVTLKEYAKDNIKQNNASKHLGEDGKLAVLRGDRFKETIKFVHNFEVEVPELGRYALTVLVNINPTTQILLDACYFEIKEKKDYSNCNLNGCVFTGKDMTRAIFTLANLQNADLSNTNLIAANMEKALLSNASFRRANLTSADLTSVMSMNVDFRESELEGANLLKAQLSASNFACANLTGANLTEANLTGADLSKANLTGANLTNTDLTGANLNGANLTGAKLDGAKLDKV